MNAQQPTPTFDSPDWADVGHDVHCPLCDYNLRGLTQPRCPECGYEFRWPDLLDPSRQRHPHLFEHHPNRNVTSFVRTALHNLLPWRFWRSLKANQPINLGRLVIYWAVAVMIGVAGQGALLLKGPIDDATAPWVTPPPLYGSYHPKSPSVPGRVPQARPISYLVPAAGEWMPSDYRFRRGRSWPAAIFDEWGFGIRFPSLSLDVLLVLAQAAWPWLTFLVLLIFQRSMQRAQLRPAQVLRCVLYSGDAVLWLGALIVLQMLAYLLQSLVGRHAPFGVGPGLYGLLLLMAFMSARLCFAYAYYLRFRNAVPVVLSTQAILLLAGAAGVVLIFGGEP